MEIKHLLILAAAVLTACAPVAPAAPPEEEPAVSPAEVIADSPVPPEGMVETFSDCQWGEVTGSGLSIWSFACPTDRLVHDAALPGFQRERADGAGAVFRYPAIRIFAKSPNAPIESVLDAVRAQWPEAEGCVLQTGASGDAELVPTGETLAAYEKFMRGEAEEPSQPCGPLGPSEAGDRSFRLLEGAPEKVVFIEWGSEIAIFDATTLRAVAD